MFSCYVTVSLLLYPAFHKKIQTSILRSPTSTISKATFKFFKNKETESKFGGQVCIPFCLPFALAQFESGLSIYIDTYATIFTLYP